MELYRDCPGDANRGSRSDERLLADGRQLNAGPHRAALGTGNEPSPSWGSSPLGSGTRLVNGSGPGGGARAYHGASWPAGSAWRSAPYGGGRRAKGSRQHVIRRRSNSCSRHRAVDLQVDIHSLSRADVWFCSPPGCPLRQISPPTPSTPLWWAGSGSPREPKRTSQVPLPATGETDGPTGN